MLSLQTIGRPERSGDGRSDLRDDDTVPVKSKTQTLRSLYDQNATYLLENESKNHFYYNVKTTKKKNASSMLLLLYL